MKVLPLSSFPLEKGTGKRAGFNSAIPHSKSTRQTDAQYVTP